MDYGDIKNIFLLIEKEDVDDYFWEYYELDPTDDARKRHLHQDMVRHVKELINFGKPFGKMVAEGCGYGIIEYYIKSLCKDVKEIVGIDLDETKVKSMNKIIERTNIDSLYSIAGDAREVDVNKNEFDYLTLLDVLEHAYREPNKSDKHYKNEFDQKALIEGVSAHLKPGGTALIFSMNGANPRMLIWSKRLKKDGKVENPVNPFYIKSVLKNLAYSDISIKPYVRNWQLKKGWKRQIGDFIEMYTPAQILFTPTFMLKATKSHTN